MKRLLTAGLMVLSLMTITRGDDASLEKAKDLFAKYVQYEHDYDAAVTNLYSDAAIIQNTRHYASGEQRVLKIPAKDYMQIIQKVMPLAKEQGDRSTYSGATYVAEGKGVRITATCYSELKKYSTPISMLVGPDSTGKWLILEELTESRSQSAPK
jgi:hypothetical protein